MMKCGKRFWNMGFLFNTKFSHYFVNFGLHMFIVYLKARNIFLQIVLHFVTFLYILVRGYDYEIDEILSKDQPPASTSEAERR